jgi:xanthine dehydrogenase accessory factor
MRQARQRGALATIVHTNGSIPSYESSRMLVREDGSIAGTVGGGCVEADVWAAAKEVIANEAPRKLTFHLNHDAGYDSGLICGGTLEIFIEPILPVPALYLFGGGHISAAIAPIASAAGFSICVADDREAFANRERFPSADRLYTSFAEATREIRADADSYIVIVSRGHADDMRLLAWAVRTPARYVGMIGSRRKVLSIYAALEEEGYRRSEFDRVYAPMGLEIGALSPAEIAVSIVAEMIAVRHSVSGAAHKKIAARSQAALAAG